MVIVHKYSQKDCYSIFMYIPEKPPKKGKIGDFRHSIRFWREIARYKNKKYTFSNGHLYVLPNETSHRSVRLVNQSQMAKTSPFREILEKCPVWYLANQARYSKTDFITVFSVQMTLGNKTAHVPLRLVFLKIFPNFPIFPINFFFPEKCNKCSVIGCLSSFYDVGWNFRHVQYYF
mgnify:CR=1 FL=1